MKNLILVLYGVFILCVVLFSYLFVDANLFYMKALFTGFSIENRTIASLGYIALISVFFAFYLYFLKVSKKRGKTYFYIVIAISSLLLLSYPAMLSYDIFNYLITSKVIYLYHENPYLVMPNEIIREPSLIFTRATNKYALYGPVWILLSAVPYFLGFKNFIVTLFLFKLFTTTFYVGTVYLIYKLSKGSLSNTIFFAINPLVLIEVFVSGHNDIAMMFLALLAFYLIRRNIYLSMFSFFLSICIKFATIFLLPIYFYVAWATHQKNKINWDTVWFWSVISMLAIFFLSPIREEMYPWYAVWFLPFVALLNRKTIKIIAAVFSVSLMLTYIPYMLLGTYDYPTPQARIALILLPLLILLGVITVLKLKKRKWDF